MTQKIDRMKNTTKRFSRRSVAIVLCFVMLLSMIATGSMLSTFAAYQGDVAAAGAALQAAGKAALGFAGEAVSAETIANADDAVVLDPVEVDGEPVADTAEPELTRSNDADLASTGWSTTNSGIRISTAVYMNSGTTATSAWAATGTNSSWYQDFDILTAGTYEYQVYGDKWFGSVNDGNSWNTPAYSDPGGSYNAHNDGNDNHRSNISATFPVGQYVLHLTGAGGSSQNYISYDLYRKKASIVSSKLSWTEPGTEMTYDGQKCYKYTFTGDGSDYYFRLNMNDCGTMTYFYPSTDGDTLGSSYDNGYNCGSTTNNTGKSFKIPTTSGGTYTIWLKIDGSTKRVWLTKTEVASAYYLTGFINGSDLSATTRQFTGSGDNYTYTYTPTTANQYFTITDNIGNTYHPASHPASSGAAYSTTDSSPTAENKWGAIGVANKQVTLTWKPTSKTLSWTVGTGATVTVYAKDGAAPINWDDKTNPGATGLTGNGGKYLYNFAAVGNTTITSSGSESFTRHNCDINTAYDGSTYDHASYYYVGNVEKGKTLTITTTIDDYNSWRTKYYVVGWNINGYTYSGSNAKAVNTTKNSTGVYTMTYTIPEKTTDTVIEITPIYYLQNNANTITFYLEGFDKTLQTTGDWGDTPYVYPFYGSLSGYQNSFGAYPGQPFVFVDGKYSTEIPITSNAIYSSANNGTIIKGITVSNGYADHVHRNLNYTKWRTLGAGADANDKGNDQYHMQTYDYDDFYKIYTEKRDSQGNRPNAIILRMKNETTYYNRDNFGSADNGINWKFNTSTPTTTLTSDLVNTFATSRNGWELLTDRFGRPVDIFGNVIGTSYSAATEQSKPAIRVVSTGYNENIAGDYGTAWLIYTPSASSGYTTAFTNADGSSAGYRGGAYTLQTASSTRKAVPPSVFLLNSASSFNTTTYPDVSRTFDGASYTDSINNYKTLYNTLKTTGTNGYNAVGRYVYITYEKNAQRYGAYKTDSTRRLYGAQRLDARWYYTYATDYVSAKIKVQVYNESTGKYQDVAFKTDNSGYNGKNNNTVASTVSGKSTENLKAYFTNTSFDGDVESGDVQINSGDYEFTAKSVSGWMFDSWQIEYDGGTYTELSTSASASTPMSASDTIVARFKPVNAGNLVLSHELSSTSTGSGTTEMKVIVYANDEKTSPLYVIDYTSDDVTLDGTYISNQYPNYYIDVTLRTTPAGDDKLTQMSGPRTAHFGGVTTKSYSNVNTQQTYNFGFKVSTLYSETTQQYTSLPYYSTIAITNHTYKITYNYPKRGSTTNNGSYTVSGTFTANEYAAYVTGTGSSRTVSAEFIKSKAPFESNFNKTLTMNYAGATQQYNTTSALHTITVNATQVDSMDTYAIFDLPYNYYTASGKDVNNSAVDVKKYTGKAESTGDNVGKILETDDAEIIEIDTIYGNFLTSAENCAQDNVSKVVNDINDPNHIGNDFITAPDEIYTSDGATKKYFSYWLIENPNRNLELARVYFPDFNYRSYSNYYVTPVYSENEADSWKMRNTADSEFKTEFAANIIYLDSTRNQWNSSTSQSDSADPSTASDLIYNDFLLSFAYKGQLIKGNDNVSDIGLLIEIVPTTKGGNEWALGDKSSTNTAAYKASYDSTIPDESTLKGVVNGTNLGNFIKDSSSKANLNDKNRLEKAYSFLSQYGQNGFAFLTDLPYDNYVFRAYAYIKDASGNIAISAPTYFSMAYTANRKG